MSSHAESAGSHSYKGYWILWVILLVLIGIFLTGILMFVIPAYDGTNILEHRLYR